MPKQCTGSAFPETSFKTASSLATWPSVMRMIWLRRRARVPQQGVAPQGLFRKVPVGGFEKRDPYTVMLRCCLDESDERIGGFGPFLSGHAPRTITKKIEIASLPDRRHVFRSA